MIFYSLLGAAACEQLIRTSLSIVEVLSQHHAVISPHHSVVSTTGRLFVTYLSAILVDSAVVCLSIHLCYVLSHLCYCCCMECLSSTDIRSPNPSYYQRFCGEVADWQIWWIVKKPLLFLASIPYYLECPPCVLPHNSDHRRRSMRGGVLVGLKAHLALSTIPATYQSGLFDLNQSVVWPTHHLGHTLDLIMSRGLAVSLREISETALSDHFHIAFECSAPPSASQLLAPACWCCILTSLTSRDFAAAFMDSVFLQWTDCFFSIMSFLLSTPPILRSWTLLSLLSANPPNQELIPG